MSEAPQDWVSVRAIAWVLDDAPCPTKLMPALLAIARACDEDGRGSCLAVSVIAQQIGKSPAQARRDIARLRGLDLITLGDQRLVEHVPEHVRPVVYNVALHVVGPKPVSPSRNPSGFGVQPPVIDAADRPPRRRRGKMSAAKRAGVLGAGACTYCGGDEDYLVVDHVVPVARGGTDRRDNLAPACWPCNTEKGALLVEEWAAKRIAKGRPWPPEPRKAPKRINGSQGGA